MRWRGQAQGGLPKSGPRRVARALRLRGHDEECRVGCHPSGLGDPTVRNQAALPRGAVPFASPNKATRSGANPLVSAEAKRLGVETFSDSFDNTQARVSPTE